MARRIMLAALVATGFGCGEGSADQPLRLDLPVRSTHRSVILGLQSARAPLSLIAADIEDGVISPVMAQLEGEAPLEIAALLYEDPLSTLSVPSGAVVQATDPSAGRPLPAPHEIHEAVVRDATEPAWTLRTTLPDALAAVRLPALDPCARFRPAAISLGDAAPPTSVLALDETWALVTTEGPEVFFVDGRRVVAQAVPVALSSGYVRADGEVWLGGADGAIFRATFTADPDPQLVLTSEGAVSSGERVIDLVGAPEGAIEHFAMTTNDGEDEQWGAFEWFDGERWRVPGLRRNTPHDATWVSRGFGLFASFFREGLVYGARDGAETSIEVSDVLFGNVVVIEQVDGVGLVAGTTAGDVHVQATDGAWRRIPGTTTQRIGDVHGYEGGLVVLRGTAVGHFPPDGSECEDSALFSPERTSLNRMDVVQDAIVVPLVALEGTSVAEQQVVWFARDRGE